MGILSDNPFVGLGTEGTGYLINQSLRFNSADSTNLTRNISTTGNRRTFTISFWFKSVVSNSDGGFVATDGNILASNYIEFELTGSNKLQFRYSTGNARSTTAVFRDPSAWYHIVFAVDTTQATDTNRIRVYVNGTEYATTGDAYPAQNFDTNFNTAGVAAQIGHSRDNSGNPAKYLSGYIAEYNHIDGQQLTPSSFGETDTITGAWIPKKYSGSYGTNGFYLKFQSSGIGTDSSGNGNTWTANNFSTSGTGTDVMSDTPTTNYATLNPLDKKVSFSYSYEDGNLVHNMNSGGDGNFTTSAGSISVSTGKWYWEVTMEYFAALGILNSAVSLETNGGIFWNDSAGYVYYGGTGVKINNGTQTAYGNTFGNGDIIGIAFDADAGKIWFAKNNTWQASGDPAAGTNAAFTSIPTGSYRPAHGIYRDASTRKATFNFGQRAFAYTPPTGYKALNTANLPEPTIKKGGKYFNSLLYTGTGGTKAVSGAGFQPDLVWIKNRSRASSSHVLVDAVRGATKALSSNLTASEVTTNGTDDFRSFDSDGFTVGDSSNYFVNSVGDTHVAWAWDANGAGSSNTAGTITSTVSANASAGFSIVTYTGTGAQGTLGHGLGVAPSFVIVRNRDQTANWLTYHSAYGLSHTTYPNWQYLNLTVGEQNSGSSVNHPFYQRPSSTVLYLNTGTSELTNVSGQKHIAYCFSEVAGYSKFGSYVSNNSADGPFIFCGFKPKLVWLKKTSAASNWFMYDVARNEYNVTGNKLYADSSAVENGEDGGSTTSNTIDILSNGFKLRTNNGTNNGGDYIFAAFAELPFKYANAR